MGFSADPITHMGYFIPIDRIKNLLDENCYQFIYDEKYTMKKCEKMRMDKKKGADDDEDDV
jgi:hypothetical protein